MSDLISKARKFAEEKHKGQFYGEFEYTHHLYQVKNVLERFNFTEENLLIAAFLHDVLEDTKTTYTEIKKEFGVEVAEIVYTVTDELGRNRKERKEKTYPKIRFDFNAIIIKLADRIANIEFCIENKNYELLKIYQKEHQEFESQLHITLNYKGYEDMWKHLNSLFYIE